MHTATLTTYNDLVKTETYTGYSNEIKILFFANLFTPFTLEFSIMDELGIRICDISLETPEKKLLVCSFLDSQQGYTLYCYGNQANNAQ